jgi:cation:H+ antiporter
LNPFALIKAPGGLKMMLVELVRTTASPLSALWTFPSVLLSSLLIAWAAESAQFLISQGLALAILAWVQTLPEFAVEAVIAWQSGRDPSRTHLMTANFTGALRLLTGLGWPMIYVTAAFFHRRRSGQPLRSIQLDNEHCVEVVSLAPPILYFFFIWQKASLNIVDAVVLFLMYAAYLVVLKRIPPQAEEKIDDLEAIPRWILNQKAARRNGIIASLFLGGALILYLVAHPFLESMLAMALSMGFSTFIFVQWVAPFLSEFPEKISAFYWARKVDSAPMAVMNMVSSNINQWTMLAAMLPVVYSMSHGHLSSIAFSPDQQAEILLTVAQSLLGMLLLANMKYDWFEAAGLFILWLIQFIFPHTHQPMTLVYFAWSGYRLIMGIFRPDYLKAFWLFPKLFKSPPRHP